jgi:hypothetical protein
MLTITRPFSENHKAMLREQGYTEDEMKIVELRCHVYDAMTSLEAAQTILKKVSGLVGYELTFDRWNDGYIFCKNVRKVMHVLIGSWHQGVYVLNGLVKQQRRGQRYTFLCNGQPGVNAVQVAHWAERERVNFPEVQKVIRDHLDTVAAVEQRQKIKKRLEYLRQEIEAERISYDEIAELQQLADEGAIPKDDVLLLEWAGVPEHE